MKKIIRILLAAVMGASFLLTGCGKSGSPESGALTWGNWNNYNKYRPLWELVEKNCPDVELEYIPYSGGNGTGYGWIQMREDDIPDIFTSSQLLDEDLAKEKLVDLSSYDFIGEFPTALLDQVSIDGGIYMLPTVNAMFGIVYNKTLMEEHGWELPNTIDELETLCAEIREAGLIPGILGTQLTGTPFSAVFNIAKTDWLTTPEGVQWEKDFLAGNATAEGMWENTMEQVQRYIDMGMFTTDPDDRSNGELVTEYLGKRKTVFLTMSNNVSSVTLENGDELGMMPYIGEDGSKNIYMYSPNTYFGISKRLTEPGNEKKLEDAIKVLSVMFSLEGQQSLESKTSPCLVAVSEKVTLPEDSIIYDAQQAMREGRAFPMTYAHWDMVLADMGQAFKEWIRGENDMDGAKSIARMDELQSAYLSNRDNTYFCESTADFTLEQTARLVAKALGSQTGADAVLMPIDRYHEGFELKAGVSGMLYKGQINTEVLASIVPGYNGEYAVMTMTGAEAKALAEAGFDAAGDGEVFSYVLEARGGALEDNISYKIVFPMNGYTEQNAEQYGAVVEKGSIRDFLHQWLAEQKTVSPGGNLWE
ncbi:MAG: ABC transporter substrate-binding protein [Butyrivibrio sp.]|nr:ABC transporter substrate-binding protein [Butyrivibrio sp.]